MNIRKLNFITKNIDTSIKKKVTFIPRKKDHKTEGAGAMDGTD